jgi:hypothetical protein
MKVRLLTYIVLTIPFLAYVKIGFSQSSTRLVENLGNTVTLLCSPLKDLAIQRVESIKSNDVPVLPFFQIEKSFVRLKDSVQYTYLGIQVDEIQISLNNDSLITAFSFIMVDNTANKTEILKCFGKETNQWQSTGPLVESGDVAPDYHSWNFKDYCVILETPFERFKSVRKYDGTIILRITKCLDPDKFCATPIK